MGETPLITREHPVELTRSGISTMLGEEEEHGGDNLHDHEEWMSTMSKRREAIKAMQDVMDRLDPHSTATSQCCPACGARYNEHCENWRLTQPCASCGQETLYTDELIHSILPEFTPMEQVGVARALTYYHWTTMEDWEEELPEDVMAHLGCKQAAYARARDIIRYPMGEIREHPEGFVYTVELVPGVPFEPSMRADEEDGSSDKLCYSTDNRCKEKYADCVERYMNVVEAPGSVSICATKKMFSVVKKQTAREFFGEEAVDIAADSRQGEKA